MSKCSIADQKTLIELGLLQVLPYYEDILLAKIILAHLHDLLPSQYKNLVELKKNVLSVIKDVLSKCALSNCEVFSIDINGIQVTVHVAIAVEFLWMSSKNVSNMKAFRSNEFVKFLVPFITDVKYEDPDILIPSLNLLGNVCDGMKITEIFPDVLAKLEEYAFHEDEQVQLQAAIVIEKIMNEGSMLGTYNYYADIEILLITIIMYYCISVPSSSSQVSFLTACIFNEMQHV